MWSLKRKRNPIEELIRYKSRLCTHGEKQVRSVDFWNTYALVVQSTTTRLMLILHQVNNWKCYHLDYVLAFTQAPTDTDVYLRIPAGFHVEDKDSDNISDQFCLKLLKNYYGPKMLLIYLPFLKRLSNNEDSNNMWILTHTYLLKVTA